MNNERTIKSCVHGSPIHSSHPYGSSDSLGPNTGFPNLVASRDLSKTRDSIGETWIRTQTSQEESCLFFTLIYVTNN